VSALMYQKVACLHRLKAAAMARRVTRLGALILISRAYLSCGNVWAEERCPVGPFETDVGAISAAIAAHHLKPRVWGCESPQSQATSSDQGWLFFARNGRTGQLWKYRSAIRCGTLCVHRNARSMAASGRSRRTGSWPPVVESGGSPIRARTLHHHDRSTDAGTGAATQLRGEPVIKAG